jgi:predicted acyl esterase
VVFTAACLAVGCSTGGDGADAGPVGTAGPTATGAAAAVPEPAADEPAATVTGGTLRVEPEPSAAASEDAAGFSVQPGSGQVAVLDAAPGTEVTLIDGGGTTTRGPSPVDELGSLVFRDVAPGRYQLVDGAGATSPPFDVAPLDAVPPSSFYADQELPAPGFGYLTTRDGTELSVDVALPGPADAGPYPTVVEYSGYQPSDPKSTAPAQLYNALGYAYVGVNIRGTGCSGGSFDFFEPVQSLDGYDAIETIAAEPWVLGHEVAMVGLSYPGITQLYVAATQPPSLAAIAPLSVVSDFMGDVFYPGGVRNTSFTVDWAGGRVADSQPAGQAWAAARIDAGDRKCAANQRLRHQSTNLATDVAFHPFWTDEIAAPLAPSLFVDRIQVPVFLAGAWQDEQTGSRFATMIDRFTGTDHLYVTLVNGLHIDAMSAGVFPRYHEFLDLYVARRVPTTAGVDPAALAAGVIGAGAVDLPPDRFAGHTYDDALRWFENEPPIQVLFEEGAAEDADPGVPVPRWTASFFEWPIAGTVAQAWYLDDERLSEEPSDDRGAASYRADPTALPATFHDEATGSVWAFDVDWQWEEPPEGTAASFVSSRFESEEVFIGSASADLWIRSSAPDTDLEVTLSEVRRDGQEVYVQSGLLRASQRALDPVASTELRPVATHREADAAPLPAGQWTLVRVEIPPFAHAFRVGSRLRLTIDAPGNSRASWTFDTIAAGETVEVGWGDEHPSRLVLPLVPGVEVPDAAPTCTLRGQPCRDAED